MDVSEARALLLFLCGRCKQISSMGWRKRTWHYAAYWSWTQWEMDWCDAQLQSRSETSLSCAPCLLARQHSLGRRARSGGSRHRRKGAGATAHLCEIQPWFQVGFGGNLLLSLMFQVWHLAEICKTGCWDCLCAHFPQNPGLDGVGANCAMLACFLPITFELKCLYCRWGMWVRVLRLYLLSSEMNISGDRFCRSTVLWCFCPPSSSTFN